MADPNGFFPNRNAAAGGAAGGGGTAGQEPVVVKIQQVAARPELNGRFGIAGAYQADRGRYLIHLVPNSNAPPSVNTATLSLKPENVVLASWTERMQAQYQLLRYDPRVEQEARRVYQQLEQRIAPVPLTVAAGILVLLWLVSVYFLGFTKTLFWTSLVALVAIYVGPFLIQNQRSIRSVLVNSPSLVQRQLEQRVPMLRGHLDKTRTMGIMIAAAVLVVMTLGYVLRTKSMKSTPPLPWDTTTGTTPTRLTTATSKSIVSDEDFYKLGFEDATKGKSYGTSLPVARSESRVLNNDMSDPMDNLPPMPPQPRSGGSNMITTMLSAFFVGRTVWDLGRDQAGPISLDNWSLQRAQVGVTLLPTWQKAILGMSVYRLVSAIMTMMK